MFTDMPGKTDAIQHRIKLTDDTPIRCKAYPLLYVMREDLRNEVDSMHQTWAVRVLKEAVRYGEMRSNTRQRT